MLTAVHCCQRWVLLSSHLPFSWVQIPIYTEIENIRGGLQRGTRQEYQRWRREGYASTGTEVKTWRKGKRILPTWTTCSTSKFKPICTKEGYCALCDSLGADALVFVYEISQWLVMVASPSYITCHTPNAAQSEEGGDIVKDPIRQTSFALGKLKTGSISLYSTLRFYVAFGARQ
jgi:hypothetical protein